MNNVCCRWADLLRYADGARPKNRQLFGLLRIYRGEPLRLDSLTGLRFLAAALVFGHHVGTYFGSYSSDGYNVLYPGMVGVSFFFVLSGFLLAWSYRPGDSKRDFWQRRFARVYPAYFAAWVLVAASNVLMGEEFTWRDALALTLTQAWFPDSEVYFAVSAVFWSLSAEAFFYLVFPFIIKPLVGLSGTGRVIILCSIILLVFGIAALVHPLVSGSVSHWWLYFFPPTRTLEFVFGIVLALSLKGGFSPVLSLPLASLLTLVTYVLCGFAPGSYMRVAIMLVPFGMLIVAAARADTTGLRSPYRSTVLVRLGEWSYAFYLIHATVIGGYLFFAERVFGLARDSMGLFWSSFNVAVMLIFSILVAGLLYSWIEKPMNTRLRPSRSRAKSHSVLHRGDLPLL